MTHMSEDYLPLGCFGKLPCYEDFLRGSVLFPSSRALQDWIFGGREALGLESGEVETARPRETLARRFLHGAPGSAELMAGVIRPSTDRGGHRSFPFMVYVHFPRRLYGKNYALLPLALAPVWDALDDAWDSLANVATRAAFEEVVGSMMIPGPLSIAEAQASYKTLLLEDASRIIERDDARLEDLIRNVPAILKQLRKGGEAVRLELPISGSRHAACSDAAFWIDLLNRQFMFRRFEPSVFLEEQQSAEKGSRVLFIFGILKATDYPLILGCQGAGAAVSRPARPSESDRRPSASDVKGLTYSSLLETRFRAGGKETGEAGSISAGSSDADQAG